MPVYDYQTAKATLTEAEKDRILAIYLNTTDGNTDWDAATTDYGSASVNSMKVSLRNSLKKIEKAVAAASNSLTTNPPAKGSKRKASPDAGGEHVAEEAPKAKRGRPSKKQKVVAAAEDFHEPEEKAAEEDSL